MSPSQPLVGQRRNEKEKINVPLNLKTIESYLLCSPTYIGAIFTKSFKKLLIKLDSFSMVVHCKFHWFCVYCTKETIEIFDPLGFLQKAKCLGKKFLSFLKVHINGKTLCCNPKIQSSSSNYCGLYVIFFIKMRDMGYSFRDVLRKFSKKYRQNDKIVKAYVEKLINVAC